jgi:N-acetylmuramoyl-L-alanine amidase
MIRRNFLNYISSGIGSLLTMRSALYSMVLKNQDQAGQNVLFRDMLTGNEPVPLKYKTFYRRIYISLIDFSNASNSRTFTNSSKRKTVLYFDRDKVVFTAENGFVLLNDQLYQFILEPVWVEGEIWVPAGILAEIFNEHTANRMYFDDENLEFVVGKKEVNISNVNISAKENGTMIHILSDKKFSEKDIHLKIANNWLYVEIYGGRVDPKTISKREAAGVISEIQADQFDQSVSLAFKLKEEIDSKELVMDTESNDFFVNLRTNQPIANEDTSGEDLEKQKQEWLVDTIVIDPGHGGKDPGAIGYGKLKEKDIVLPIGLKLGAALKKQLPDVNIIYTRDSDVFIPLWKRTKIANENNGKLFVSLHCNSNNSKSVNGFETYFLSADKDDKARDVVLLENESVKFESTVDQKRYEGVNFVLATLAQNAFLKYSQYFASLVQKSLKLNMQPEGMKDRGVKQGPFWVMVGATMPNILVEMGFISNKFESKLLKQKSIQTKIAESICNGIVKYKNDFENAL